MIDDKTLLQVEEITYLSKEEYLRLRELIPDNGTEYTQWQKIPHVPEPGKVCMILSDSEPQLEFDEVHFYESCYSTNEEVPEWRHQRHYNDGSDIHYWKYAEPLPEGYYRGYNVGD